MQLCFYKNAKMALFFTQKCHFGICFILFSVFMAFWVDWNMICNS